MSYTTVIIDDSHIQRVATTFLIKSHPQLSVLGDFEDPVEGIHFAQQQKADLLFLDVLYEDVNIFEILEVLHPEMDIIFNSSWAYFKERSGLYRTAGFLEKPMRRNEFESCVNTWIRSRKSAGEGSRTPKPCGTSS